MSPAGSTHIVSNRRSIRNLRRWVLFSDCRVAPAGWSRTGLSRGTAVGACRGLLWARVRVRIDASVLTAVHRTRRLIRGPERDDWGIRARRRLTTTWTWRAKTLLSADHPAGARRPHAPKSGRHSPRPAMGTVSDGDRVQSLIAGTPSPALLNMLSATSSDTTSRRMAPSCCTGDLKRAHDRKRT